MGIRSVYRKLKSIQYSQDQALQREVLKRTNQMLEDIKAGKIEPPIPHLYISQKHGLAERIPFSERTTTGQYKLVKLWVMEQMARDVRSSDRGVDARESKRAAEIAKIEAEQKKAQWRSDRYARVKPTTKPEPTARAPETPEQAQARIARVNKALLRDLGVKP